MRDILEDTGKLSAQKVTLLTADRIRRDYRSGAVSMRDLAVSYGVGASTISRVIRSATP
jgi:DNA-binding MurR/RpiR family transcriptional regulator